MMKKITLSADESLIEQARKRAVVEHTTRDGSSGCEGVRDI